MERVSFCGQFGIGIQYIGSFFMYGHIQLRPLHVPSAIELCFDFNRILEPSLGAVLIGLHVCTASVIISKSFMRVGSMEYTACHWNVAMNSD